MNEVQPIRDKEIIAKFKNKLLKKSYRDYMLFVFGINTGLRISDILPLRKRDVTGIMKSTLSEIMGGKVLEYRPEPETPSPDDPDKCCCNEIEVVYGGDADPSDD